MIPKPNVIIEVIQKNWDGFTLTLEPVPTTVRLFRIKRNDEHFMVRINFDRGKLTASEMVEFVNHLSESKCPVPYIVPTKSGQLSAPIQDMTISIESELPGVDCGSNRLDILPEVGKGLALIHNASEKFAKSPAESRPLAEYVEQKLTRAQKQNLSPNEKIALSELRDLLTTDHQEKLNISVRWLTTHGDVRGPNVLVDGNTVGFTDIYSTFAPALADIVMVRDKWLLGDPDGEGRRLENKEVLALIKGYISVRPFNQEDRDTFGVLWAAYAAEKLTHFATHKNVGGSRRDLWDFHNRVLQLPNTVHEANQLISTLT